MRHSTHMRGIFVPNVVFNRKDVSRLYANALALHEDTEFVLYRDFNPLTKVLEYSLFYREPGEGKMRVDMTADEDVLALKLGPVWDLVKVTRVGPALRAENRPNQYDV